LSDISGKFFQNTATLGFYATDKNGRFDENIDLHRVNDRGEGLVHTAAINGHLEFIKALAELGVNLNKHNNNYGFIRAPVYLAALYGHTKIVQFLADHGVDLNKTDIFGNTPVFLAAEYGHSELVQFLAEQSVDLNRANTNGVTPAQIAAFKEYTEVVRILIESKAKLDTK
jgi:ankyrin repeat protein